MLTPRQLAPAVQLKLMLAGVANGWKYGLIQAVTLLAEDEDAKDLQFDAEIEAIRSAAAAAAAAAAVPVAVGDVGDGAGKRDQSSGEQGGAQAGAAPASQKGLVTA